MRKALFLILLAQLFALCAHSQFAFTTRVLKDSLFIPWEIIYGPDDHIWFTQKNGFICRMDTAGIHTDTLYHEAATVTMKESGMLGMALHPDFFSNPYVYVVWEYLNPAAAIRERVCRYTYSPLTNTLSFPTVILDSIHGYLFHNGCRLLIVDDKLFISVADAATSTNPQDLHSINGKILRINLDGTIPSDNPFPGSPIWTWGHRNPQGLVYANGMLYSSEHGPDTDDEINLIQKGRNYGWPNVRGFCDLPIEMDFCRDSNVALPMQAWTPTIAPCGIDYYHHNMFPMLRNSLLLTTLKDQHLYQLQLNDTHDTIISTTIITDFVYGRLRDLCISPEGKIFISTSNSDPNDTGAKKDRIVVMYNDQYYAAQNTLKVFPNPATTYINFVVPLPYTSLRCIIHDMQGRKIADQELDTSDPRIDVSTFAQGIYIATIFTNNGTRYKAPFLKIR